jgi:hypothetical protein
LNDGSPAKKRGTLAVTATAKEQLKAHRITKEMVMDVMNNRIERVRLDNGSFQFRGSPRHPDISITARFSSEKHQWAITDVQLKKQATSPESETAPVTVTNQRAAIDSMPEVVFTNHAKDILKREFLDHRIVEQLIRNPSRQYDEDEGKVRFIGKSHGDKLHVIAKFLPEENKWLVITVELRFKHDPTPTTDLTTFDGSPTDEHPGLKFTTHALERMELRKISPYEVQRTILSPQKTFDDEDDKVKFIGHELTLNRSIHAIGRFLPEENQWLVISLWVRGEDDDGSLSTWQPKKTQQSNTSPRIAFTNNIRQWMNDQRVNGRDIERVVLAPLRKHDQEDGKVKFIGNLPNSSQAIHIIGKFLPDENKWLLITAWMPTQQKYRVGDNNGAWVVSATILIVLIIIAAMIWFFFFAQPLG